MVRKNFQNYVVIYSITDFGIFPFFINSLQIRYLGIHVNNKWNVGKYERIYQKIFLNVAFSNLFVKLDPNLGNVLFCPTHYIFW